MKLVAPSSLLRTALVADAAVSGAVALLQLAGGGPLADLSGLARPLLVGTGLFLAAYAALLLVLARQRAVPSGLIAFIVVGNVGWAVAAVALLASGASGATALGVAYAVLQAVAVLAFAALEYAGLRNSTPVRRTGLAAAT